MVDTADIDITADLKDQQVEHGQDDSNSPPDDDIRSLLNAAMAEDAEDSDNAGSARERGPDGRFVAKQTADSEQNIPVEQEQSNTQNNERASPEQYFEQVISSLPEEHRPTVTKLIEMRDAAFNSWAQQKVDQLNGYEAVERIIGPRRESWAMNGLTPEAAISQLFALSDLATRDPVEFIRTFAGSNNIDLSKLVEDAEFEGDPELRAVNARMDSMEQAFNGYTTQQQNTQVQQQQAQTERLVEAFALEKDAQGQLLRPHMQAVADDMFAIVPSIRSQNPNLPPQDVLQQAYERAVWANPNTRVKMVEAQRIKEAAEHASRARNAGGSVVGGPSSGVKPAVIEHSTVRGALEAAFQQHS